MGQSKVSSNSKPFGKSPKAVHNALLRSISSNFWQNGFQMSRNLSVPILNWETLFKLQLRISCGRIEGIKPKSCKKRVTSQEKEHLSRPSDAYC